MKSNGPGFFSDFVQAAWCQPRRAAFCLSVARACVARVRAGPDLEVTHSGHAGELLVQNSVEISNAAAQPTQDRKKRSKIPCCCSDAKAITKSSMFCGSAGMGGVMKDGLSRDNQPVVVTI